VSYLARYHSSSRISLIDLKEEFYNNAGEAKKEENPSTKRKKWENPKKR
jgi:hypothetical protein